MFLFYNREGLKRRKIFVIFLFRWGGQGGGGVTGRNAFFKNILFMPFRIIAGLLKSVLHLVLHFLLFLSSILDDIEN